LSSVSLVAACATAIAQQPPAQQPASAPVQLGTIDVTSPTLIATPESQIASAVTVITSEQLERPAAHVA
jgi:hypothetical protein